MNLSAPALSASALPPPSASAAQQQTSLLGLRKSKKGRGSDASQSHSTRTVLVPPSGELAVSNTAPNTDNSPTGAHRDIAPTPFSSPASTLLVSGGNAKRKGLRGKVKGALRRMVSHDESVFAGLVKKGDNDSTISNIHSTHSGSTFHPNSPILKYGNNSSPQLHTSPGTKSSKQNLTKKFNSSMRTFLSSMVTPVNVSPKPKDSVNRKHQRLASIRSNVSLEIPFEDDDYSESDDSDDEHSEHECLQLRPDTGKTTRSRSHSPAMQRRFERRDRKNASRGMSSSANEQHRFHSSNPRLRRRQYRRIKTGVSATTSSSKKKTKKKKPTAPSRPAPIKSTSRRLVQVQKEEEGVPGETFLLSVLDDIHARKKATGELHINPEQDDSENVGDPPFLGEPDTKKKKTTKKKEHKKRRMVRKKRQLKKDKGSPKPTSDTDALSPADEEEMALLAPDPVQDTDEEKQEIVAEELEMNLRVQRPLVRTRSLSPEGWHSATELLRQTFVSDESSNDSGVFEDNESYSDDAAEREEESDLIPPELEAMLEPEPEDQMLSQGAQVTAATVAHGASPGWQDEASPRINQEDSEVLLMKKSRIELREEVELSLKNFTPLLHKKQENPQEISGITESSDALLDLPDEIALEDSFEKLPDFNFNFSNVVVKTNKSEGSPTSLDDSVAMEYKALEKKQEREGTIRRPSGLVRRRSCPSLKEEGRHTKSESMTTQTGAMDQFLHGGDFWEGLLHELMPSRKEKEDGKPNLSELRSHQSELPQLLRKLDDTRPSRAAQAEDRSVGSESRRGRSRSKRKRSSTTNGASDRRDKTKGAKESSGRRPGVSDRRRVHKRRSNQQGSDSHGERSESNSRHAMDPRGDGQLPVVRERSTSNSHSKRGHGTKRNEGSKSMRKRLSISERRMDERERSRSTSKESRQKRLDERERSRSTSKESRQNPDISLHKTRDRSRSPLQNERERSRSTSKESRRSHVVGRLKTRDRSKSNSKRPSSMPDLPDLRHDISESNKRMSESQLETRDRSRSKSKSNREFHQSHQTRDHRERKRSDGLQNENIDYHGVRERIRDHKARRRTDRLHQSESLIDYHHDYHGAGERNRSKSKRLGKHGISRSEPGRSHRRAAVEPKDNRGEEGDDHQLGGDRTRLSSSMKEEAAGHMRGQASTQGKKNHCRLHKSEGSLVYHHQRIQSRSKSGRNRERSSKREKSSDKRRPVEGKGETSKSRRNSVKGDRSENTFGSSGETDKHQSSAVRDDKRHSRRERSSSKHRDRSRSRSVSLERARRSAKIVSNAKQEVQKINRTSISNGLGNSSQDLSLIESYTSSKSSLGRTREHSESRERTKQTQRGSKDDSILARQEGKPDSKGSKSKGRKSREGRPRSGSRDHSQRSHSHRTSVNASMQGEEEVLQRDQSASARSSERTTLRGDGEDSARGQESNRDPTEQKLGKRSRDRRQKKDEQDKETRKSILSATKEYRQVPSLQIIRESQSERPARTLDEALAVDHQSSSSSASERQERRVSLHDRRVSFDTQATQKVSNVINLKTRPPISKVPRRQSETRSSKTSVGSGSVSIAVSEGESRIEMDPLDHNDETHLSVAPF